MLGRCQSTRTAKIFYQQLPGCLLLCIWHKLPCEERRLLLSQCQTAAANQGADRRKMWAHHHLWLAWIGTDLKSPAVWLDGTTLSGKSPPSFSLNSCSAAGCDCVSLCVHMLHTLLSLFVCKAYSHYMQQYGCKHTHLLTDLTFCTVWWTGPGYLIQHDTILKNTVFTGGESQ